jgi:hypothetical protein
MRIIVRERGTVIRLKKPCESQEQPGENLLLLIKESTGNNDQSEHAGCDGQIAELVFCTETGSRVKIRRLADRIKISR